MKPSKTLKKRRRREIGYDKEEDVYYVESKSRPGFYHEVSKIDDDWFCNCEFAMMNNFKGHCGHIRIVVWYRKYQPELIDAVISELR